MEDIQDLELLVELTPDELEDLKGGFANKTFEPDLPHPIPDPILDPYRPLAGSPNFPYGIVMPDFQV